MAKIFVVDDDPDMLALICAALQRDGHQVDTEADPTAVTPKRCRFYDLLLFDIMMPKEDGFSLIRRIRTEVDCPILFLTARIEDSDKVQGFAVGGDDYIIKPFSLAELEARVAAHLRREMRRISGASVRFGRELSIDYSQRQVFVNGKALSFPKKEFAIIELLSVNAGQVFDKERIYEKVWGYDGEGDSGVVAEHIRRIRARLSAVSEKTYIETVWGCGYKWVS